MGYRRQERIPSGRTVLNPEDSDVLHEGDKLIAVSRAALVDGLNPAADSAVMARLGARAIRRVAQVGSEEATPSDGDGGRDGGTW